MPTIDTRPEMFELQRSYDFFATLHSAIDCGMDFSTGVYTHNQFIEDPLTRKTDLVAVTQTVPLSELSEHNQRLDFAARQLDKIPVEFWKDLKFMRGLSGIVFDWALEDRETVADPEFQRTFFGEVEEVMGPFLKAAKMNRVITREITDPIWDRSVRGDNAEQCLRIISAYTTLSGYFQEHGLPEGITDF